MDLETIHQQQQLTNNNSSTNSSRSGLVSPTPFINGLTNGLGLLAAISANPTNSFSASSILSSVTTNNNNNNIVGYPYISKPFSNTGANALMMDPLQEASSSTNAGDGKMDVTPDTVPITVRSDLPQLKDITIEKVLCGTNLTWTEFLRLFHVELDPNLHIVKGSGGRKANLLDKVGEYVKILKRRMKVYLVNVELMHPAKKMSKSKSSNSSTTSSATKGLNPDIPSSSGTKRSKNNGANGNNNPQPSKRKSKKPKLSQATDEEPQASHLVGNTDSIEIPEKSVSMETQVFSNSNASTGLNKSAKERKKRQNRKNIQGNNVNAANGNINPTHGFLENFSAFHNPNNPNEQALNLVNPQQNQPSSKLRSTLEGYMSLASNPNDLPMFPLNFSNNNGSHHELDNDLSSTSSNGGGDDEEDTSNRSESVFGIGEFDIKPAVVQFLVHKISNKNMLRIREELTNLRNADDYFKLTSVAPLAAGLLEQMFCRNQPKVEPN